MLLAGLTIYSGITNPIFNIGYWVRGPILVLLLYYYLIQLKKRKLFIDEFLALYFCLLHI
ncbi:hypothetical protein Ct9H90mP29_09380 [bacterium]|nr:MAG: hypothetical protein Ct9H90mP29_09380 [bacterium]